MESGQSQPRRKRGQGQKAVNRLSEKPLKRNMVIRCSDELYRAALEAAKRQQCSLSDYVRHLILTDIKKAAG
ncbi:MAG: toxin-antitoxin system HicB family antitoxin [Spirochaetales bacterium]